MISKRQGNQLRRKPRRSLSTNSRITGFIQENKQTGDDQGGYNDNWVNRHTDAHYMSITPKASLQVLEYETINAEVTHVIELRFEIPVIETNRIVSRDIVYEILSIENIQNRDVMNMLFCKERQV